MDTSSAEADKDVKDEHNTLTISEGLMLGWCLYHGVSAATLDVSSDYGRGYDALLSWCNITEPYTLSYPKCKPAVMARFKQALEHNAWMSRNSTRIHDMMEKSKMVKEWVVLAEKFLLITPEEAAEIEFLGGSGSERKRNLAETKKGYEPSGEPATWIPTISPVPEAEEKKPSLGGDFPVHILMSSGSLSVETILVDAVGGIVSSEAFEQKIKVCDDQFFRGAQIEPNQELTAVYDKKLRWWFVSVFELKSVS